MVHLKLSESDRALLDGRGGEAAATAMRLVVKMAGLVGAPRLIDVTGAHIDGCLYHGIAGLDFAERLAGGEARVAVPTTLNVGSLDLLHPEVYRGDAASAERARRLMDLYVSMGCRPTWTCAPYQLPDRPALGQQVAWAESNAVVFANSVLGARTERYGDFSDICAALTGRVPDAGLHRDEHRRGRVVFRLTGVPGRLLDDEVLYPLLGHVIGGRCGTEVPVVDGLPPSVDEDRLKALGAAAASSGSVAMFHAVGVTPEAPTLEDALGGEDPERIEDVTARDLVRARESLGAPEGRPIVAVSVGTPHFSAAELGRLTDLLRGVRLAPGVDLYVSTSRAVLEEAGRRRWLDVLGDAGATVVTDTCTYVTPILRRTDGVVMTSSAKWAYYAPGNLGVEVAFGSLEECVRSAEAGRVTADPDLWGHG